MSESRRSLIGTIARPFRDFLERRGVRTVMHKNRAQPGFAGLTVAWRADDPDSLLRCGVATIDLEGKSARFLVVDEDDLIQREHAAGRIYEPEELAIIARYFHGGAFVDIGSNVGNHAVYAGLVLGADPIIAVEPNPAAAQLCELNLSLNDLGQKSIVHRCGMSDRAGRAEIASVPQRNLGGARLRDNADQGSIKLVTGDSLLADIDPAFIKIDTEGFELLVLRGLVSTLGRSRPILFVEVEDANQAEVTEFVSGLGYVARETFARYPGVTNFLFEPDG